MSRLPSTGPSLARYLRQQARQAQRQAQSSSLTSSGLSVTAAGVTTVVGALALPPGSVTDAALANPTVLQAVYMTATNFALAVAWGEVVGVDLIVPPRMSRLLLTATAWVYAVNNTAGADDAHVRVSLGLVDGQSLVTPLPVSGYGTISAGLATLASALTVGSTIRLFVAAKTTTGTFTADPANTTCLSAALTWAP